MDGYCGGENFSLARPAGGQHFGLCHGRVCADAGPQGGEEAQRAEAERITLLMGSYIQRVGSGKNAFGSAPHPAANR